MVLGHFAVGLAAKRAAPQVSLGTWFMAAQFLDLLWPMFLLLGWERVMVDPGNTLVTPLDFRHYPYSHSLAMACLWAFLFSAAHFVLRRDARAGLLLGAAVLSHWILDLPFHRPDLPLYPGGSTRLGLGLWNHLGVTLAAEFGLYALGNWVYLRTTRARNKIGRRSLGTFAWAGLAGWVLVAWAYWIDRNREPVRA